MPDLPNSPQPAPAANEPGGCLAHGFAWLVISGAMLVVMFLITAGCYLLYRLVG